MSRFGKTLFSGSRFIFWTSSPALLIFAIGISVIVLKEDDHSFGTIALLMLMVATSLLLILGLYDPVRFRWSLRCVTGVVFLAYLAYLTDMVVLEKRPFTWPGNRAEDSPTNALLGFLIIGLPCLWFTLFGRFTSRSKQENADNHYHEEDDK